MKSNIKKITIGIIIFLVGLICGFLCHYYLSEIAKEEQTYLSGNISLEQTVENVDFEYWIEYEIQNDNLVNYTIFVPNGKYDRKQVGSFNITLPDNWKHLQNDSFSDQDGNWFSGFTIEPLYGEERCFDAFYGYQYYDMQLRKSFNNAVNETEILYRESLSDEVPYSFVEYCFRSDNYDYAVHASFSRPFKLRLAKFEIDEYFDSVINKGNYLDI